MVTHSNHVEHEATSLIRTPQLVPRVAGFQSSPEPYLTPWASHPDSSERPHMLHHGEREIPDPLELFPHFFLWRGGLEPPGVHQHQVPHPLWVADGVGGGQISPQAVPQEDKPLRLQQRTTHEDVYHP